MKLSRVREIFHALQGILNHELKPGVQLQLTRALHGLKPQTDTLNAQVQELRVAADAAIAQKQAELQAAMTEFINARKTEAEDAIAKLLKGEVDVQMPTFAEADLLDSKQAKQIIDLLPPLLEFVQATPKDKPTP